MTDGHRCTAGCTAGAPDGCTAADDAAIRSLIGLAAHLGDEGQPEQYRRIYTDNATWAMGTARQVGVDDIIAAATARQAQGVSGPATSTRHLVVPMHIEIDGDAARAVSYFAFLTDTATKPAVARFGSYRDELARTTAGWRIRSRTSTLG